MPQLKAPSTLYTTSLSKTRLWIWKLANDTYQTFGNYENVDCQRAICQFNMYLTSSVPTHIIDELYNSTEVLFKSEVCEQCNNSHNFEERNSFDQRIVLSMYINNNMKTLTAHKLINDNFWKASLISLQSLVRLDLNKVCTDEILEVVGKHCRSLEFVNIVSKSFHTRTKDRHNALKLQLCVSDAGLDFLSDCKQLKEIWMTCYIRKGCGGRQITDDGIKRLLLSLPKLRRINYMDTGAVLDFIPISSNKLTLMSVNDYHPSALRIFKMEILCPNLTELHLTYAYSSDDYRSDIISALCCSGLQISTLNLTNFPFDDFLKRYLEVKGSHLRDFSFVTSLTHSINELFRVLACTCPNLESMTMHFHFFDRGYISSQPLFNSSFDSDKKFFCNVKSLIIKGSYWDFIYVLPLLLKHALMIKRIVLINHTYSGSLDETLLQVQHTNPFAYLETVSFLKGVNISFQFLKLFVMSCPVLKSLTVESESQAYNDLVVQLRQELLRNNFDIHIDAYSTF